MAGGRTTAEGIWLLDLVVGGHTYRFATEGVEVEDASGLSFEYAEGLAEPGLSYGSLYGVGDASVTVSVLAEAVDWALLVAEGHALDRCPAILRRWYPGRVLERARVALRGLTDGPSYGAMGEPLELSIVRSVRDQCRTFPRAQDVIDRFTWPIAGGEIPENSEGACYPMIIGCPGGTERDTPIPVVPVPVPEFTAGGLSSNRVVWLGGHATQVRLRWAGGDMLYDFDLAAGDVADLLGRTVQYALTGDSDEEGEYLIGFRDDDVYGGGIRWRDALLRGAGSVIEWVLTTYYAGPVDRGRVALARSYLDQWKIDTFVNSPVNAWDWLSREVLPVLPVEMREGDAGVYPAILRYDLTRRDAVAHLDATPGTGRVSRASSVTLVADIVNEITVDFRPVDIAGAKWLNRTILTGDYGYTIADYQPGDAQDTRVIRDLTCTESLRRYGVRPQRVQLSSVWDTTTAGLVARHIAAKRAWPRRAIQYAGGPWLEEIDVGSCVTLTDPELHVDRAVCLVADVTPGPEALVDLLLLDGPLSTESRSTT